MNKTTALLLKSTRRVYAKLRKTASRKPDLTFDVQGQQASDLIKGMLDGRDPCMISRLGLLELETTLNYLDVISRRGLFSKTVKYIRGETGPYWWDDELAFFMHTIAGFFPARAEFLSRFANILLKDPKFSEKIGPILGK